MLAAKCELFRVDKMLCWLRLSCCCDQQTLCRLMGDRTASAHRLFGWQVVQQRACVDLNGKSLLLNPTQEQKCGPKLEVCGDNWIH